MQNETQQKCHTQEKEKPTVLLTQKCDHLNRIQLEQIPHVTHVYGNSVSMRIRSNFNITESENK